MSDAAPLFRPAEHSASTAQPVVVISKFTIANGMDEAVHTAFCQRAHLVDDAPGFLGLEVMHPVGQPAEVWLVTHWADEQSYHTWHRGHSYHASHQGIPRGLKLVRGSIEIQVFNVFAH